MIQITRTCSSLKGTFGVLSINDIPQCVTCELPWLDNAPGVSCIPPGTYAVVRHASPKFPLGNTWEITGVPARSGILIHNANDIADLEGCIAVGQYFGMLNGMPAVLNSGVALSMLNHQLPDSFTLTIQ